MRLVVICLLLWASPALAQVFGVRLLTEDVRLEASWQDALPPPRLQLTAPCLACHPTRIVRTPAQLALLLPSGVGSHTKQPRAANRAGVARRPRPSALPARRGVAIGDSWQLGHGRELSIRLTPTQEECAPLMRLKF